MFPRRISCTLFLAIGFDPKPVSRIVEDSEVWDSGQGRVLDPLERITGWIFATMIDTRFHAGTPSLDQTRPITHDLSRLGLV